MTGSRPTPEIVIPNSPPGAAFPLGRTTSRPRLTDLIKRLPSPLASALSQYLESQTYTGFTSTTPSLSELLTGLHRVFDATELATRFVVAVLLNSTISNHGEFPEDMIGTLAGQLSRPSIVEWANIGDAAAAHAVSCPAIPFVPGLAEFYVGTWRPVLSWLLPLRERTLDRCRPPPPGPGTARAPLIQPLMHHSGEQPHPASSVTPLPPVMEGEPRFGVARACVEQFAERQSAYHNAWWQLAAIFADYVLIGCSAEHPERPLLLHGRPHGNRGSSRTSSSSSGPPLSTPPASPTLAPGTPPHLHANAPDGSVPPPAGAELAASHVYLCKRSLYEPPPVGPAPASPKPPAAAATPPPRPGVAGMEEEGPESPGSDDSEVAALAEPSILDLSPLLLFNYCCTIQNGLLDMVFDSPALQLYQRFDIRNARSEYVALVAQPQLTILHDPFAETPFQQLVHCYLSTPGKEDFGPLVRELREGFLGRERELDEVSGWIAKHRRTGGVLWIHGPPGVGKSALAAALCERVMAGQAGKRATCLVPYFFTSGDPRCTPKSFFMHAVSLFSSELHVAGRDVRAPSYAQFGQLLDYMHTEICTVKSVLFVVDGIDEVLNTYPFFLEELASSFRVQHPWVILSRFHPRDVFPPHAHLPDLVPDLHLMELRGLPGHETRLLLEALCPTARFRLYDRDVEDEDFGVNANAFADRLQALSRGNPLYVKLLAADLNEGRLTFEAEESLPAGLEGYCADLLSRLVVAPHGQVLLSILCLLAYAQEPITDDVIPQALSLDEVEPDVDVGELLEAHPMVSRRLNPEGYHGWILAHDAYRKFIRSSSATKKSRQKALKRLLRWCGRWPKHEDAYALRHYARHLFTADATDVPGMPSPPHEVLYGLAREAAFRERQFAVLRSAEFRLATARFALERAVLRQDFVRAAEFAMEVQAIVAGVQEESPWEAMAERDWERLWSMLSYLDRDVAALWYLLAALRLTPGLRLELPPPADRRRDTPGHKEREKEAAGHRRLSTSLPSPRELSSAMSAHSAQHAGLTPAAHRAPSPVDVLRRLEEREEGDRVTFPRWAERRAAQAMATVLRKNRAGFVDLCRQLFSDKGLQELVTALLAGPTPARLPTVTREEIVERGDSIRAGELFSKAGLKDRRPGGACPASSPVVSASPAGGLPAVPSAPNLARRVFSASPGMPERCPSFSGLAPDASGVIRRSPGRPVASPIPPGRASEATSPRPGGAPHDEEAEHVEEWLHALAVATDVARTIRDPITSIQSLVEIALVRGKAEAPESRAVSLDSLRRAALDMRSPWDRVYALLLVASAQASIGVPRTARQTLRDAAYEYRLLVEGGGRTPRRMTEMMAFMAGGTGGGPDPAPDGRERRGSTVEHAGGWGAPPGGAGGSGSGGRGAGGWGSAHGLHGCPEPAAHAAEHVLTPASAEPTSPRFRAAPATTSARRRVRGSGAVSAQNFLDFFNDVTSWVHARVAAAFADQADAAREAEEAEEHLDDARELLADARHAADGIADRVGRVQALVHVGTAHARARDPERARAALAHAYEAALTIDERAARCERLCDVGAAQRRAHLAAEAAVSFGAALAAAQEAPPAERPHLLRSAALAMLRAGDAAGARDAFGRAAGSLEALGTAEQVRELLKVAGVQHRAGLHADALASFSLAKRRAEALPERRDQARELLRVAAAQAKHDLREEGYTTFMAVMVMAKQLELAEAAPSRPEPGSSDDDDDLGAPKTGFAAMRRRAPAANALGGALAGFLGAAAPAHATVGTATTNVAVLARTDPERHAACLQLCEVGLAAARGEVEKRALAMFKSARDTAAKIEDLSRRSHALREVAALAARGGQGQFARSVFTEASKCGEGVADGKERAVALLDVACAEADAGQASAAAGHGAAPVPHAIAALAREGAGSGPGTPTDPRPGHFFAAAPGLPPRHPPAHGHAPGPSPHGTAHAPSPPAAVQAPAPQAATSEIPAFIMQMAAKMNLQVSSAGQLVPVTAPAGPSGPDPAPQPASHPAASPHPAPAPSPLSAAPGSPALAASPPLGSSEVPHGRFWEPWRHKEEAYLRRTHEGKGTWDARRAAMEAEESWRKRGDHDTLSRRRLAAAVCCAARSMCRVNSVEGAATCFRAAREVVGAIKSDPLAKCRALLDVAIAAANASAEGGDACGVAAAAAIAEARACVPHAQIAEECGVAGRIVDACCDVAQALGRGEQSAAAAEAALRLAEEVAGSVAGLEAARCALRVAVARAARGDVAGAVAAVEAADGHARREVGVEAGEEGLTPVDVAQMAARFLREEAMHSRAAGPAGGGRGDPCCCEWDFYPRGLAAALRAIGRAYVAEGEGGRARAAAAFAASRDCVLQAVPEGWHADPRHLSHLAACVPDFLSAGAVREAREAASACFAVLARRAGRPHGPDLADAWYVAAAAKGRVVEALAASGDPLVSIQAPAELEAAIAAVEAVEEPAGRAAGLCALALCSVARSSHGRPAPPASDARSASPPPLAVHRPHAHIPLPLAVAHSPAGGAGSAAAAAAAAAAALLSPPTRGAQLLEAARDVLERAAGAAGADAPHAPWLLRAAVRLAASSARAGDLGGAFAALRPLREAAADVAAAGVDWRLCAALGELAGAFLQASMETASRGTLTAARNLARSVPGRKGRARAYAEVACAYARLGLGFEARFTSKMVLADRREHIPSIAQCLQRAFQHSEVARLLIPCAYKHDAAAKVAGLLAESFPTEAEAIVDQILASI